MNFSEISQKLKERFGDKVLEVNEDKRYEYVKVDSSAIVEVMRYLRADPQLKFRSLMCLSGVDYPEELAVVYHLHSIDLRHKVTIKAFVPKTSPELPTVEGVWRAANWHERECYDLLGVIFKGHSDLRRILLPDDWVGYPLRKDYKEAESYHGIPTRAPHDVQNQVRKVVAVREAEYKRKIAEERARQAAETAKKAQESKGQEGAPSGS